MNSSNKQQLIVFSNNFDSFKYSVISYLQKLECGECSIWDGLKIIEFEEEIYVGNVEEEKIVGSIMFPKKDDRTSKIFLIQIRDNKGNLKKPCQRVVVTSDKYEHFNFIPRIPTNEEFKVINDIFKKVKDLTYGIKNKKVNVPRKRVFVREK